MPTMIRGLTNISTDRPILQADLRHIREVVHKACPEVVETKKWSFSTFRLQRGCCAAWAAFKEHCAFGFWKQSLLDQSVLPAEKTAMGSFGRIKSIKDLPDDKTLKKLIAQAMKLNDAGVSR